MLRYQNTHISTEEVEDGAEKESLKEAIKNQ